MARQRRRRTAVMAAALISVRGTERELAQASPTACSTELTGSPSIRRRPRRLGGAVHDHSWRRPLLPESTLHVHRPLWMRISSHSASAVTWLATASRPCSAAASRIRQSSAPVGSAKRPVRRRTRLPAVTQRSTVRRLTSREQARPGIQPASRMSRRGSCATRARLPTCTARRAGPHGSVDGLRRLDRRSSRRGSRIVPTLAGAGSAVEELRAGRRRRGRRRRRSTSRCRTSRTRGVLTWRHQHALRLGRLGDHRRVHVVQHDHVGLDRRRVDPEPLGQQLGVLVVLPEPRQVVVQRVQTGGGEHADLAHPPPSRLRQSRAVAMRSAEQTSTEPTGVPRPLEKQTTRCRRAGRRWEVDPGRDGAFQIGHRRGARRPRPPGTSPTASAAPPVAAPAPTPRLCEFSTAIAAVGVRCQSAFGRTWAISASASSRPRSETTVRVERPKIAAAAPIS